MVVRTMIETLRRLLFHLFTEVELQPDLPDEFLLGFDPVNMFIV
jgi:hypothetical protein